MDRARWMLALLVVVVAGWWIVDASAHFVTGDFIGPKSADGETKLGPWANLVQSIGIDPRSPWMAGFFLAGGVGWLGTLSAYLAGARWAWIGLLVAAVISLGYLPFGTLCALGQLALLLGPERRSLHGSQG